MTEDEKGNVKRLNAEPQQQPRLTWRQLNLKKHAETCTTRRFDRQMQLYSLRLDEMLSDDIIQVFTLDPFNNMYTMPILPYQERLCPCEVFVLATLCSHR